MVRVSEAASAFMLNQLENIPVPTDVGYRLDNAKQGYRLRLDRASKGDRVLRRQGQVMLVIAPDLDEELEDTILDVKDGDEGALVLEPAGDQGDAGTDKL
jgi:hypothetical protein